MLLPQGRIHYEFKQKQGLNEMKKSDLKMGQIVELRNGQRYYFFGDILVNDDTHMLCSDFAENLLYNDRDYEEYDIVRVYEWEESFPDKLIHLVYASDYSIMWERKEYEVIEVDGNSIILNEENVSKLRSALKM